MGVSKAVPLVGKYVYSSYRPVEPTDANSGVLGIVESDSKRAANFSVAVGDDFGRRVRARLPLRAPRPST